MILADLFYTKLQAMTQNERMVFERTLVLLMPQVLDAVEDIVKRSVSEEPPEGSQTGEKVEV